MMDTRGLPYNPKDVKYISTSPDARKKYLFQMVDVKMDKIRKLKIARGWLERKHEHGTHDGSIKELLALTRIKSLEIDAMQRSADEYAGYILREYYKPADYNPRENRNEPT